MQTLRLHCLESHACRLLCHYRPVTTGPQTMFIALPNSSIRIPRSSSYAMSPKTMPPRDQPVHQPSFASSIFVSICPHSVAPQSCCGCYSANAGTSVHQLLTRSPCTQLLSSMWSVLATMRRLPSGRHALPSCRSVIANFARVRWACLCIP